MEWVRGRLPEHRFLHTVGVYETVPELCSLHGVAEEPLRMAALLHDCARELDDEEMLRLAGQWGLHLREEDQLAPVLLHGRIAIEIARREFGDLHPDTESAILNHTSGHPTMSDSDKVFFLADSIEPGRVNPVVEELRLMARGDIDAAMLRTVEVNRAFLVTRGAIIDPDTLRLHEVLRTLVHGPRASY